MPAVSHLGRHVTEMTFGSFREDADEPPPQATSRGAGAGLVRMRLDSRRLPISVTLDLRWESAVAPHEYAATILDGYQAARWSHDRVAIESGDFKSLSSVPLRRQQLLALLETTSMDQHRTVFAAILGAQTYRAHGDALDRADEPAVELTADRSTLLELWIAPEWAQSASREAVADDVLRCVDRIRAQLPRFDENFSTLSDEELEARYRDHLGELMRRSVTQ